MDPYILYLDEQLIRLLKSGDRKAFEYIFMKYWLLLFDAAYKRVYSKEVAEEIIQEHFTYLWCKRENIQLTDSFSTYIHVALKIEYPITSARRSTKNNMLKGLSRLSQVI